MILRVVYTKTDYMKFLGHLELMRMFERAFRRLEIPLGFTEGFNPHPRMTFGGPLSVGVASLYEVMEFELLSPINYDDFMARFNATMPQGIDIKEYYLVSKTQSLMSALALSTYEVTLTREPNEPTYDLVALNGAAESILIRKKNKQKRWVDKDLKPYLKTLELMSSDENQEVYRIEISSSPDGSAKPSQIVEVLLQQREGFDVDSIELLRTGLFYLEEGQYKPLARLF